ncbi:MAG: hypothetical protein M3Q48_16545 [Actinomycetota bacterium]|nr:hypothetical protein [Actinomycetota bacterium]
MRRVSHAIDRVSVSFDDPSLVGNAGLLLVATLALRLGLEELVNKAVCLSGRVGGSRPGRKVMTLVVAIVAGGSHIDHANVLRAGGTRRVLPFRVMAPSTLGTFLRAFSFGHVRQLEAVVGEVLRRAWAMGARSGVRAAGGRRRLDHLRRRRQGQAGRRLRLHQGARLPPAPRHPGRHRRGAARPHAHRLGQHLLRVAGPFTVESLSPHRSLAFTGSAVENGTTRSRRQHGTSTSPTSRRSSRRSSPTSNGRHSERPEE